MTPLNCQLLYQAAEAKRARKAQKRYRDQLARTMGQHNARARSAERQQQTAAAAAERQHEMLGSQEFRRADAVTIACMAWIEGLRQMRQYNLDQGPKKRCYPNTLQPCFRTSEAETF